MSSIDPSDSHSVEIANYLSLTDTELQGDLNNLTANELSQLILNADQLIEKKGNRDFSDKPISEGCDGVYAIKNVALSILVKKKEGSITPEALAKKSGKVWDCISGEIDPDSVAGGDLGGDDVRSACSGHVGGDSRRGRISV